MSAIRQPIIVVLGHVDAGKTSLLDKLRGTAVQRREAGGITQQIGASFFPKDVLKAICADLLDKYKIDVEIPGLLFIDTPGHEAFSNLRFRGGSAADIAILVVDITKGLEAQTFESIDILRGRKVPFIIALNKIDLLAGWISRSLTLEKDISSQEKATQDLLDNGIFSVMGQLSIIGLPSEVYYRASNFTKQIVMVPISATTGEGIPELLTIMLGLVQQYMKGKLKYEETPARGLVIEVKEEVGMGIVLNTIILNGRIQVNDEIVVGTDNGPVLSHVKALFMPKPLDEMRDPRDKFLPVKEITAAAGVSIFAPDVQGVLAGTPLLVVRNQQTIDEAKNFIDNEVKRAIIKTDKVGVVVKSDTLGSLEALLSQLERKGIQVRMADIGPVSKKDITEAEMVKEKDVYLGVVLAFNQKTLVENPVVPIFSGDVIYGIIDSYIKWTEQKRAEQLHASMETVKLPAMIKVMKGYIFRRSNPAVFGITVLGGKLRSKVPLMNSVGEEVGMVEQIQVEGNPVAELNLNEEAAISVKGVTIGRQIKEDEILYTLPNSAEAKFILDSKSIPNDLQELMKDIISIRRKVQMLYAY
ncbi:MAG: translation initiation factor IF-2 [Thaumarchaeota archaeon]|nr:translation initiation factor IF-2 [Nitrososphaerota archaeon]